MRHGACWLVACLAVTYAAAPTAPAENPAHPAGMHSSMQEALPSPPAEADVLLNGRPLTIHYNTPLMRGRKIMGGLVPYGQVWRTGANPATSFKTAVSLRIGNATVPAGSYTLYTLPSEGAWMLIINKQTGQWGTKYDQSQDLARIEMKKTQLPQPQEKMSISFDNTHGANTELHVRWESTDVSVPVTAR